MQYSEIVTVSERFQRSIRIDTDINDLETIRSYHCPASSAEVLITMGNNFADSGQAAFTWTGPYGSGKSSLAVALASLLDGDAKAREAAKKSIGLVYSKKLVKLFNAENGEWEFLPIVGHKGNPEEAVIEALKEGGYLSKRKTGATATLKELQKVIEKAPKGLFIVIDEMGKFLEAASSGGGDIYFFQQLAELASRSNGKLIVLGILHQSFAEYARKLTREIRDEWTKIQGRFVDIPLNVAGEEQLELIARAIKSDKKPKAASQLAGYVAENIANNRPVNGKVITDNLTQTWPLHPVVSCLLGPISRRRFGQNQRSVFGFLNSAEPHGFQSFLKNNKYEKDLLYRPSLLWDYLRANLEPSILASPDGHRWALAVDALNRCEARGGDKQHVELVKCIALVEMFKERSGLTPEEELLRLCVPGLNKTQFNKALKDLEQWSIILFKKHLKAYSIYAGSDFDIEAAVDEAAIQIADLDINDIKKIAGFQPVVAKRHYHITGAFRWFEIDLVPASQAVNFAASFNPKNGATGLFLVVLPTGEEDQEKIEKICQQASKANEAYPVIASHTKDSWLIRQHAKELKALEWIKNNNSSLGGDSVARKEIETRIASNSETLEDYLSRCFTNAQWYVSGRKRIISDLKGLNELVSDFADNIFAESPVINSELVNRIKPSSNANAALKQLLVAMVTNHGKERLGIEGYPAEGGLFETLLATTGLYRKSKDGEWEFRDATNSDLAKIKPLWKAADKLFKGQEERQVTLPELYEIWGAAPYGVKDGLLPFFAIAYMLTRTNEFAVYLEGLYRANLDDLLIDHLMKNPGGIALRKMNFSEIGQNILIGVIDAVNSVNPNSAPLSEKSPPLQIARQLVSTVLELQPWVLRTRTLSKNTIKVRELIKNASDPNKVLFDDLPELFSEHQEALNKGDVTPIIQTLQESLAELVNAYPALLQDMHKQILAELQVKDASKKALTELHDRAENVLGISGDFRLDAFAGRLRTYSGTHEDIEGIASLAANRPAQDWIDLDVNKAKLQIAELAQKFNHMEAFGRVQNRKDNRHAVAFVVGLDDRAKTFAHEFVVRETDSKAVLEIERQLEKVLDKYSDIEPELMYAALAKLGARLLQAGNHGSEAVQRKVS